MAYANIANAPQKGQLLANELITIDQNTISSLSNKSGTDVYNPKYLIGIYATKYGVSYDLLYETIRGESGFQNIDNGIASGWAQFTLPTWLGSCSTLDDRFNIEKSIDCMARMWSEGYAYLWDQYCFNHYDKNCIEKRGLYPKI